MANPFLQIINSARKAGIKGYHGSPHDFNEFKTSAIGTGEGAQQYGRGFYFGEAEEVAKRYRDQLTPRDLDYEDWLTEKYKAAESNQDYARMEMYERAMLNETPQDFKDLAADVDYDEDYRALAAEVGEEIEEYGPDLGHMYEVNIDADPDELIDWDELIDEQPKKIMDKLKKADWWEYAEEGIYESAGIRGDNPTGADLVRWLERDGQEYAAEALEDLGVKGIKYADAFTRHKPKDKRSSNYVIFDPRIIEISKKYGISIPLASAVAAGGMTPEEAQAGGIKSVANEGIRSLDETLEFASPKIESPGLPSLAGQLGLGAMSEIGGVLAGGAAGVGEYLRGGLSGPEYVYPFNEPATAESIRDAREGTSEFVGGLYDAGPEAQEFGQEIMRGIGEEIAPIAEYAMKGPIMDERGLNMLPLIAQKLGIPAYQLAEMLFNKLPEREQEAAISASDVFL